MHTKADKIFQDRRHARRRQRIFTHIWGNEPVRPTHYYTKNKVHCSCTRCSGYIKTNSKIVSQNWKHSDMQKMQKGLDKETEAWYTKNVGIAYN